MTATVRRFDPDDPQPLTELRVGARATLCVDAGQPTPMLVTGDVVGLVVSPAGSPLWVALVEDAAGTRKARLRRWNVDRIIWWE